VKKAIFDKKISRIKVFVLSLEIKKRYYSLKNEKL